MSVPSNLKYVDTHEWVDVQGNEEVIGLTAHAVELLGDVVYLELPKIGDTIAEGASIGVVESVKAASDIYTPVSGKIVAVNDVVLGDPALLNQDAYVNWLYRVEFTKAEELEALMSAEDYQAAIS